MLLARKHKTLLSNGNETRLAVVRHSAVKRLCDSYEPKMMNLDDLRTSLSDVDRQLVELIARRQQIVSEIGKRKRSIQT